MVRRVRPCAPTSSSPSRSSWPCSSSQTTACAGDLVGLPDEAVVGSIGCANPVALAHLEPGEDVLDLGSGGGIDVLLSARRVGPRGRSYGLDMTPEMLQLARDNQRQAE